MSTHPNDRIAHQIPDESRELVARLLSDRLRPLDELAAEVEAYVGFVREFATRQPGASVDAGAAERLAERCMALLGQVRGGPDDDRRLVQAACLYLVAIEGDLDAGDGFADDEAVIAAVEAALGGA
jgi:hypothetical protein